MTTSSYADLYSTAEAEGNLNKGGGSSEQVPAGPYNGVVTFVSYDKQPVDGKKFGLRIEISEGPLAGKTVWANVGMSKKHPKSATAFFITAEKFGLSREFFFRTPPPSDREVAGFFKDVPVTVEISHRDWNGKTVQDGRITSVNKSQPTIGSGPSVPTPPAPPAFNPLGGPIGGN